MTQRYLDRSVARAKRKRAYALQRMQLCREIGDERGYNRWQNIYHWQQSYIETPYVYVGQSPDNPIEISDDEFN